MKNKNEGFSLVELIVVIAIMAILVGVLAPAYLKYVEKSRKSTDIAGIDQIFSAGYAVATDYEYHVPADAEFVVEATGGSVVLSIPRGEWAGAENTGSEEERYCIDAENEWRQTANKGNPYIFKSKDWNIGNGKVVGVMKGNGDFCWSVSAGDQIFNKMIGYSPDFASNFSAASN